MQVLSPVNIATLHEFRMWGLDTFHENKATGEITLFKNEQCDRCGCDCEGANSVTLTKGAFLKPHHKAFLLIVGFEPTTDGMPPELGATDDGDACCPDCHPG
jgi:hypothetical protein